MGISNKKFDPTVCFTFFGTWVDMIYELEQQGMHDAAWRVFKMIADYSLHGLEPDFDSFGIDGGILKIIWKLIEGQIDQSVKNRKRGFAKEGLTDAQKSIIVAFIENPDASIRSVAGITGKARSYVEKTKKKYQNLIDQGFENDQNLVAKHAEQ